MKATRKEELIYQYFMLAHKVQTIAGSLHPLNEVPTDKEMKSYKSFTLEDLKDKVAAMETALEKLNRKKQKEEYFNTEEGKARKEELERMIKSHEISIDYERKGFISAVNTYFRLAFSIPHSFTCTVNPYRTDVEVFLGDTSVPHRCFTITIIKKERMNFKFHATSDFCPLTFQDSVDCYSLASEFLRNHELQMAIQEEAFKAMDEIEKLYKELTEYREELSY